MGAKTRWILQGFHDPDIEMLNRSVSTPETEDVPLALQLIASIRARAFTLDVRAALTQSTEGQRKEPLYATPPPEGIPGETDPCIVIELLTEIYGLISGPTGWRKTVLTELKHLDFKAHPQRHTRWQAAPVWRYCHRDR